MAVGLALPLPLRAVRAPASSAVSTMLVFPGLAGNYCSVPDAPNLDITGDVEIVVRASLPDWDAVTTVIQGFVTKGDAGSGVGRAWTFRRTTGRLFNFMWSPDGTTWTIEQMAYSAGLFQPNQLVWLRSRFLVDDGSGNRVFTLSYSTAQTIIEPTTWQNVAAPVVTAGTAAIYSGSTYPVVFGTDHSSRGMTGRIARLIVRSTFGGPAVLDVAETDAKVPATTSFTATSGQTVTVTQTAGQQIVQAA